jgi:hypothetical protein
MVARAELHASAHKHQGLAGRSSHGQRAPARVRRSRRSILPAPAPPAKPKEAIAVMFAKIARKQEEDAKKKELAETPGAVKSRTRFKVIVGDVNPSYVSTKQKKSYAISNERSLHAQNHRL